MIRPEFVNYRMAGESFKAYRARRKTIAKAIDVHLRGRLVHKSSEPVFLPLLGVDAALNDQVLRGNVRDVQLVNPPVALPWPFGPREPAPRGKQIRVGRTKGVTFRHSAPRAEVRKAALAASREARV